MCIQAADSVALPPGQSATGSSSSSDRVNYDIRGNLVDEAAMLSEGGIEVGVYVKKKGSDCLYVIEAVGNKRIVVRQPKTTTPKELPYTEFRDEWTIVYDKTEIKDKGLVTNYEDTLADNNEAISVARQWARVQLGLQFAQEWVDKNSTTPTLRIETKPEKKVFLTTPVRKGRLFLLPHSDRLAFDFVTAKPAKKTFDPDISWIDSLEKVAGKTIYIKPEFMTQSANVDGKQALTEPFWAVRRTPKGTGGGNLRLDTMIHNGSLCTQCAGRTKVLPQQVSVCTPVLTNPSDLEAGAELIWPYDREKTEKRKAPVMYDDSAKKQKVAKSAEF